MPTHLLLSRIRTFATVLVVCVTLLSCEPTETLEPPPTPSLYPTPAYLTFGRPVSAIAADFDNDGNLDIAIRSVGYQDFGDAVVIRKGIGEGMFGQYQHYSLQDQGGAGSLFSVDFDNDGRLDLITSTSKYIHILFGRGNGTFVKPIQIDSTEVIRFAMGDVNNDGLSDIVTVNRDLKMYVRLNNGRRGFGPEMVIGNARQRTGVALGDMNGDRKLDIVLHREGLLHGVFVLLGHGDGTFDSSDGYLGLGGGDIYLQDFDQDGFLDVVLLGGIDSHVLILKGNGDGSLATSFFVKTEIFNQAIGDLNGDGFPDIVGFVGSSTSSAFGTLLNNGDGTLESSAVPAIVIGPHPFPLLFADFDADGENDVLFGARDSTSNYVWVEFGNGDGTFRTTTNKVVSVSLPIRYSNVTAIAVKDVNADNQPDIVVASPIAAVDSDYQVSVFLKSSTAYVLTQVREVGQYATEIKIDDLNQDGFQDLVVLNRLGEDVSILRGLGNGTFHPEIRFGSGSFPRNLAISDMNGDDVPDLVILTSYNSGGGSLSVLLGIGDGTFQQEITTWININRPLLGLATTDLDLDGIQDIVVGDNGEVLILRGNGDGTLATPTQVEVSPGSVKALVTFDIGGTAHPDFVSSANGARVGFDHVTSKVDVVLHTEEGFTRQLTYTMQGSALSTLKLTKGSLDEDTREDLVLLNLNDISIFRGAERNLFGSEGRFRVGITAVDLALADAEGDGDLDIFVGGGDGVWVLINQTN